MINEREKILLLPVFLPFFLQPLKTFKALPYIPEKKINQPTRAQNHEENDNYPDCHLKILILVGDLQQYQRPHFNAVAGPCFNSGIFVLGVVCVSGSKNLDGVCIRFI